MDLSNKQEETSFLEMVTNNTSNDLIISINNCINTLTSNQGSERRGTIDKKVQELKDIVIKKLNECENRRKTARMHLCKRCGLEILQSDLGRHSNEECVFMKRMNGQESNRANRTFGKSSFSLGFKGLTCNLCNTDVSNIEHHMQAFSHFSQVEHENGSSIYCIICQDTVAMIDFRGHEQQRKHQLMRDRNFVRSYTFVRHVNHVRCNPCKVNIKIKQIEEHKNEHHTQRYCAIFCAICLNQSDIENLHVTCKGQCGRAV